MPYYVEQLFFHELFQEVDASQFWTPHAKTIYLIAWLDVIISCDLSPKGDALYSCGSLQLVFFIAATHGEVYRQRNIITRMRIEGDWRYA